MTEAQDAAAQVRVPEIATELAALIAKLRAVHDEAPVSPLEGVMLLGEEDMDTATALRSTIECVLADQLEPALRELRKLAAFKPPGKEGR